MMKRLGLTLGIVLLVVGAAPHPESPATQRSEPAAGASVTGSRCEYKIDPLGMDVQNPRLSWQVASAERGWTQSAYQIRVARSAAALDQAKPLVWDSGQVTATESVHRIYAGPPLQSGSRYYWRVRVWDAMGRPSGWSETAWWEMGLLRPQDWQVSWIEPGLAEDATRSNPAPLLRKDFRLRAPVRSARAYVTSLGLYDLEINGRRVGDEVFTPGWTSYDDHLQHQTHDGEGRHPRQHVGYRKAAQRRRGGRC
jgi:alpha-L-rhamnosidase